MRKYGKILALVILVATMLSVFAVFGPMASAATMQPIVQYDLDSKAAAGVTVTGASKYPSKVTGEDFHKITSVKDENGNHSYFKFSIFRDPVVDDNGNVTSYKAANSPSNVYLNIGANKIVVKDYTNGSQKKNTDFMVIDFDISTNSDFDYMYFHNRYYSVGGATSQDNYIRFAGDTVDGGFYTTTNQKPTTNQIYNDTPAEDGWIHVSYVYDYRGSDWNNWFVHVYYNGVYAGSQKPNKSDAARFNFIRWGYSQTGDQQVCEANIANFTITSFPVGYDGDLGKKVDMLANKMYTLDNFSDLDYCFAEKPAPVKYASVERNGETFNVSSFYQLDTALVDGDKVTLYSPIYDTLLVPKGANITFVDAKGNTLTPGVVDYSAGAVFVQAIEEVDFAEANIVARKLKDNFVAGYGSNNVVAGEVEEPLPPAPEATTLYDINNSGDTFSPQNGANIAFNKKVDINGNPYYNLNLAGVDQTALNAAGPYIETNIGLNTTKADTYVNSNNETVDRAKSIKYLIVDMDISTDTTFIKNLSANLRCCQAGSTGYKDKYIKNLAGLFNITGDGTNLKFSSDAASSPTFEKEVGVGNWTNVTFVYDFTGETNTEWKLYLYIDGVFYGDLAVGEMPDFSNIYFLRFELPGVGAEDASVNLANLTVKRYGTDYAGQIANLGNSEVNLNRISELVYTQEKLPVMVAPEESKYSANSDIFAELAKEDLSIRLLSDATLTLDAVINASKNAYINLNGKTLTIKAGNLANAFDILSGNFNIFGGKVVVETNDTASFVNLASTNALLTFKDVELVVNGTVANISAGGATISGIEMDAMSAVVTSTATADVAVNISDIKVNTINAIAQITGAQGINTTVNIENVELVNATAIAVIMGNGANYADITINNAVVGEAMAIAGIQNANTANITVNNVKAKVELGVLIEAANATSNVAINEAELDVKQAVFMTDAANVDFALTSAKVNGATAVAYAPANNSRVANVRMADSEFNLTGALVTNGFVPAEGATFTANYNIANTTVFATNIYAEAAAIPVDASVAGDMANNFAFDTCYIDCGENYLVEKGETGIVDIVISGETPISTNAVAKKGTTGATLGVGYGYFLAPRSAEGVLGYCVTTNVTAYPYVIGGEEYEFYWYGADEVTYDKIPVEIPNEDDSYFVYTWAPDVDINGCYYPVMAVDIPVKANMNLALNFSYYLYLPTNLGDKAYETVAINGESVTPVLVNKGGVQYMMIALDDISVTNAADALTLTLDIVAPDGTAGKFEKDVSITAYLDSLLNKAGATEAEVELAAGIINYVDKAYELLAKPSVALDALTASDAYTAVALAKGDVVANTAAFDADVVKSVAYVVDGGYHVNIAFADNADGNVLITYYENGVKVLKTVNAAKVKSVDLEVKACDLHTDISIRYANSTASFNFAGYVALAEANENTSAEMVALLDALWIYSECAIAYQG